MELRGRSRCHGGWFGFTCLWLLIVKYAGKDWIDKVLPPIVVGPIIMVIGLNLATMQSMMRQL